ncbi:hypothetical protein LIER_32745 [Lithospermum erythrorhizon]|uniref:Uncharacterized protein n=1 Tax=Lithospermum erythrorhizon TaxID=34254 RepID=A0AAV3RYL1_LITER
MGKQHRVTLNKHAQRKDKAHKKGDVVDMEKVPYVSAVGSLMYAMLCTRPDIACSVGLTKVLPKGKHYACCAIAGFDIVPASLPY